MDNLCYVCDEPMVEDPDNLAIGAVDFVDTLLVGLLSDPRVRAHYNCGHGVGLEQVTL